MLAILSEGQPPSDALARGIGPTQDPRAKSSQHDGHGSYARGLSQTKRLNQLAHAPELLFGSDQVPAVEARLHLGIVCERQLLRVVALALRKVEYMVGDRCGAGVITCGKNGSKCPSFLSNKPGPISNPLGEDPDARPCRDRLRCRVSFRLLQGSDESATKLQLPRVTFWRLQQSIQHRQSLPAALLRFRCSPTRHRLLTGLAPISDRLIRQPSFGAVLGKQCRLGHRRLREAVFERCDNPGVKLYAPAA